VVLPDSINVLAKQDPRLVYDLLLLGNFESFGKAKEIQDDWDLQALGTEPVPASTLHQYRAAGLIKNSNIRGDGKFLFPVNVVQGFRANIVRLYKRKSR
jgi:hypothetical protein